MRSVTSFSSDIKCVRWAKRLKSNVKQWWLSNAVALELWGFQNVSPSPLTSRFTNPGHVIAFWWICKRHGPATFRTWHCSKMDGVTLCNTEISSLTSPVRNWSLLPFPFTLHSLFLFLHFLSVFCILCYFIYLSLFTFLLSSHVFPSFFSCIFLFNCLHLSFPPFSPF